MSINAKTELDTLRTTPWPKDGLESVSQCPVCGESDREIQYSDLVDNIFRVAPGKWTLWKCTNCSSAYIDPRPTPDTVHLAYAKYFTHREVEKPDDYKTLSAFRKLRRRLANGYINWRYSRQIKPLSSFGILAAFVMPNLRNVIDRQYRNLPRLPKGGGRLLDVGCGNGSFLSLARDCGWDVVGLDPDSKAVANCAKQGLLVHKGGIEYFDHQRELFDVITLNHVIEHVYNPLKVLKTCYALLRPSGQFWLETPNIDCMGHTQFQQNWFDLDPPRHLVLFNRHSIEQAFIRTGFPPPHDLARPSSYVGRFKASFAMQHGHSGLQPMELSNVLFVKAIIASCAGVFFQSQRGPITISSRKTRAE